MSSGLAFRDSHVLEFYYDHDHTRLGLSVLEEPDILSPGKFSRISVEVQQRYIALQEMENQAKNGFPCL